MKHRLDQNKPQVRVIWEDRKDWRLIGGRVVVKRQDGSVAGFPDWRQDMVRRQFGNNAH